MERAISDKKLFLAVSQWDNRTGQKLFRWTVWDESTGDSKWLAHGNTKTVETACEEAELFARNFVRQ